MRLGLSGSLQRTRRSTNPIENLNGSVQRHTRNFKRWRGGEMIQRWVSAALLDAERRLRRVRGFPDMPRLMLALDDPSVHRKQPEIAAWNPLPRSSPSQSPTAIGTTPARRILGDSALRSRTNERFRAAGMPVRTRPSNSVESVAVGRHSPAVMLSPIDSVTRLHRARSTISRRGKYVHPPAAPSSGAGLGSQSCRAGHCIRDRSRALQHMQKPRTLPPQSLRRVRGPARVRRPSASPARSRASTRTPSTALLPSPPRRPCARSPVPTGPAG